VTRLLVGVFLASAAPALAQAPAARLGAPVLPPTTRASAPDSAPDDRPPPAARLGPISSARIGEGPADASPEERYNWGAPRDRGVSAAPVSRSRNRDDDWSRDRDDEPASRGARLRDPAPGRPVSRERDRGGRLTAAEDCGPDPAWWPGRQRDLEELRGEFPAFGDRDRDRLAFQGDTAFDNFVSPITNPFLAEDPRSVTELRPIFIYQSIPANQPYLQGGSALFLGTQARVAFTDRFSVVLHKFGMTSITPGTGSPLGANTGLSEIWIGPKFVFWRNPDTQTIAAAGMQFQFPIGSGGVFQDTGGLAIVPYVTVGTLLGRTDSGSFHLINVTGYQLGTDQGRSDYLFDTLHFDWDISDQHRFYPTLELSWFHYTTNGMERPFFHFEGRDLANIGGFAAGHDIVTLAPGFRYKFSEFVQLGVATEFPILGNRDLFNFRLTVDLIWRY
jgi:hypothetical protein